MKTTLNAIRANHPCRDGWKKLLSTLGKTAADDEPLSLVTILDSNGIDDALWCLRAVTGYEKEMRLFAVWCARQVQHLMKDPRSVAAIDVADRFSTGSATKEELSAAESAACDSARAAAWDAAWDAAESAACDSARAAAESAAESAARDAVWAAAWAAARDAVWAAAESAAESAACDSARAAAESAAWDAAWAAAWDAARGAQEKKLRELIAETKEAA